MSTIIEYKCPACGGTLEFDVALQKMKCPYCDTVTDVEDLISKDEVLNDGNIDVNSLPENEFSWKSEIGNSWEKEETEKMSVFICKSCGGEIVGDENTGATECPYCGNQVVFSERFGGGLKPDYVIPFKLTREQAKDNYKKHIEKKFLLPKLFKQENHIDEIKGIYVPFWLHSSKVNAFARFDAEKIRTWSDSNYEYTEVTTYDVFRSGKMNFNNIPADGSSKMPDDLMESVEPFDFSEAVPFQSAYLAGYFADKYDVDEKETEERVNERLRQSTIDVLRDTVVGYTNVSNFDPGIFRKKMNKMDETSYDDPFANTNTEGSGVSMTEGNIKYALYPVYLLSSTYKGEKYTFAMNGQTGKFVGNLPMDKTKRNITFAGLFAGLTALSTVLLWLFSR